MKSNKLFFLLNTLIISILFSLNSCREERHNISCLPRVNFHAIYNLNLPLYNPLTLPNGFVELNPDGTNGPRGVIIINTGHGYNAYDRNAPHICPDNDTTLKVVDGIKIVCPKDGAEWMLLTGQPLNDATQGYPLHQYKVYENHRQISISN